MYVDRIAYQTAVEAKYDRRNIRFKVRAEINADDEYVDMMKEATMYVKDFLSQDYYESKNVRLAQLTRDPDRIVEDIFITMFMGVPEQDFTAVVGSVVSTLRMTSQKDGLKTASELVAVICECDLYDIYKDSKYDKLKVKMNYELSPQLQKYIRETEYLPPTIVEPDDVTDNFDYTSLTKKSSLILGKGNHHDKGLSLDSINRFNKVPLCLNVDLLTSFSEMKPEEFTNHDHEKQWHVFVKRSYQIYKDLIQHGNEFYLYHKYDMRGRCYAQGYHVSTQGNKFKKAIVEFAEQEVVNTCL